MTAQDLTSMVTDALQRRGIDPAQLAGGGSGLDPRGWVLDHDEAVAWRTENARRALARVADGEFDLDRLPPIQPGVAQWVELQKKGSAELPTLLLRGQVGCGKTTQLVIGIRELVLHHARRNENYPWHFTTHRNFAADVRPGSGHDPEAVMERLMTADLVGFDDLGDYHATDWAVDCTSRLINHRSHHRLPTIYSTNLPSTRTPALVDKERELGIRIATLADPLDGRVLSRLSAAARVIMDEVDYRAGVGRVLR